MTSFSMQSLHGSPFLTLGNSGVREAPSDEIALELAQATVGFSRAWKDELGFGGRYWVYGDQVKKSAPTGEYLPRGSFFIDGKKNLVRHVKVELSVGVTSNFPGENGQTIETRGNQVAVICGPEKSIAKHCIARLKIRSREGKVKRYCKTNTATVDRSSQGRNGQRSDKEDIDRRGN